MGQIYGVGVIGAGVIFSDHAKSYESLGGRARLVGLADTDASKLKAASERHFSLCLKRTTRRFWHVAILM